MPELIQFRNRKEWLEARHTGVGGSDAASILGVDPFRSELETYADKLAIGEPIEENEAMLWGRKLEPLVAQAYSQETKRKLEKFGHHFFRSTERPFAFASLDRLVVEPKAVLEIKTSNYLKEADLEQEIPINYQVQMQHSLGVMGLEIGSFAILLNARHLFYVDVPADKEFIELLFDKEAAFWKRVQEHRPPDPDASESARAVLQKMYPKDSGQVVALPESALELDRARLEAMATIETAEAIKNKAENDLKALIAEASVGVLPNGVEYSWKHQSRKAYEVKAAEFRVLRRKGGKENGKG